MVYYGIRGEGENIVKGEEQGEKGGKDEREVGERKKVPPRAMSGLHVRVRDVRVTYIGIQ